MLYMINHGAVSYGANTILTNINFEINAGQKIAVVGRNGCGKTTLLKLIEGEVALEKRDSDEDIYIAKSGNPVIGYLKQIAFADETISMETEVRKVFEPYREKQRELEAQRQIMESDPSELNIRIYTQMQEQFTDMGGYYYEKESMRQCFANLVLLKLTRKSRLENFQVDSRQSLDLSRCFSQSRIFFFWTSRLTTLISRQLNGLRII